MKLTEGAAMPVVSVDDGSVENDDEGVIAIFFGPRAYDRATDFIVTLDEHLSGRYSISICDVMCDGCGNVFWHEAWYLDTGCEEWACPICHRQYHPEDAQTMRTPHIPELES